METPQTPSCFEGLKTVGSEGHDLNHLACTQKPHLHHQLGSGVLNSESPHLLGGRKKIESTCWGSASSKGCCLNPKGWWFLAPLIIHETHPLEDLGVHCLMFFSQQAKEFQFRFGRNSWGGREFLTNYPRHPVIPSEVWCLIGLGTPNTFSGGGPGCLGIMDSNCTFFCNSAWGRLCNTLQWSHLVWSTSFWNICLHGLQRDDTQLKSNIIFPSALMITRCCWMFGFGNHLLFS